MTVMRVRGPNNVGRPVQTEQTLLRYTSAIAEQKKFWELLAQNFDEFRILGNNTSVSALNNMQQGVRTDATCKIQQCLELFANNVASAWTGLQLFYTQLTNFKNSF